MYLLSWGDHARAKKTIPCLPDNVTICKISQNRKGVVHQDWVFGCSSYSYRFCSYTFAVSFSSVSAFPPVERQITRGRDVNHLTFSGVVDRYGFELCRPHYAFPVVTHTVTSPKLGIG